VSNLLIIFIFFYENNEKYLIAYIILKSKKLGVARGVAYHLNGLNGVAETLIKLHETSLFLC
jgi:hypothetical protein